MIRQGAIALLGRAGAPTDAVEEYCSYLGEALRARGISLAIERVPWEQRGWRRALRSLRRRAKAWKDTWVLVQYTALAWSARCFPLRFSGILRILKAAGVAFYSPQKKNDLGEVLLHVLQDEHYRASLAQQRYFSWTVIAARYAEFLEKRQ